MTVDQMLASIATSIFHSERLAQLGW